MENASKALIIAGAILISIVLVSVGVLVVRNLNTDEAFSQMDQQVIDSFNSKFVDPAGPNVRGTVVKTMISNAITSNGNNESSKQIEVEFEGTKAEKEGSEKMVSSATLSQISNNIITSHRYTVVIGYAKNGLVNKITITDNNK